MSNTLGAAAENYIARLLEEAGNTVICRNYTVRYGEIDIIYLEKESGDLVFGEVKFRKDESCGEPYEYVTKKKLNKIRLAALHYLSFASELEYESMRIDVFSVKLNGDDGGFVVEHFENVTL